ncbi:GTP-binding protein [bacterium C-53]|nr:GTP-binding protein [Lachnospiraceae bacterium]NBI02349.1 GTP-binding protein [Lachnospiraceae bacterium]RKJ11904.1 GTP-binding protein [bacterium C-53]
MTKVDIISGFLGAGKTTLIKKLIAEVFTGQQIVLIENEFGEIGIDGGFLKESGVNITEMNSGCICCSLVGDFGTALTEVIDTYHPDRIIIEPSGVGKLSDVAKAVENVMEHADIVINSMTAVVDATKAKIYMKNFGEFFNNQIESARTIILSRTGGMKQEKLDLAIHMIREHNSEAPIITTDWSEIDGKTILGAMEESKSLASEMMEEQERQGHEHRDHDHHHEEHHHQHDCECGCGHDHDHSHHHADEVFTSWGEETSHKFTEEKLKEILMKLSEETDYGTVLRAKGIVAAKEGEWFHFDLTPGEYEIRRGVADYTGRLCVIGADLKEDALKELFEL